MKHNTFGVLALSVLAVLVFSAVASAASLGVDVDKVKLDNKELSTSSSAIRGFERGQELDLVLELTGTKNVEDLEVFAYLSHRNSDVEPVRTETKVFRLEKGVSRDLTLTLKLPESLDEGDYKLRLRFANKDQEEGFDYTIHVGVPDHLLVFKDIVLTPSSKLRAGEALNARVVLENRGDADESNVKVTATIADLDVSDFDLNVDVAVDAEVESNELYLPIPKCAKGKAYDVTFAASYDDGNAQVKRTVQVDVADNSACEQSAAPAASSGKGVRGALETVLLVLVVLLVVVGLLVGFSKLRSGDEE